MAIVIVFEGWFHKALALLGGTRTIWQAHQREELGRLAEIVGRREARRATAAAA